MPQGDVSHSFQLFTIIQEVDPTETLNVEDADLHVSDYFLIWKGDDQSACVEAHNDGTTEVIMNYQNKLTWNEIILDDFS